MPRFRLLATMTAAGLATVVAAQAATLGDPKIGFTAERVLVVDGRTYAGRMWSMPGEQRHEQTLSAVSAAFILHADSTFAAILLPDLHTAVEFPLPPALAALGMPALLGTPIGKASVNGVATTKYAVDKTIPEGHLSGAVWLSRDGIPMRCDGSFAPRNGKTLTVHWELRHLEVGRQDKRLFEIPPGYATLSPQAAGTLLGLRLAPPHRGH